MSQLELEPSKTRRCPQCWRTLPLTRFQKRRAGKLSHARQCAECRKRYRNYQRGQTRGRPDVLKGGVLRVTWIARSHNRKIGAIPTTFTSASTCPPSCALYGAGCYAEFGYLRAHWKRVPERGLTWGEFLDRVRALPEGQVWRHNTAGDLPGEGDELDVTALLELADANIGRLGFTFTHKPLRRQRERDAVRTSIHLGLAINLSADTLEHADQLAALGIGPVAVLLPSDTPDRGTRTPGGLRVVVCPAETIEGMTCEKCKLCCRVKRPTVVGFRAHGQFARSMSEKLVQLRLPGST